MIRYHMNQATGEPGQCSAQPGNCPFGGDEVHFTSPEAARTSYEDSQSSFPSPPWNSSKTALNVAELMVEAQTVEPGERYDSLNDDAPIGAILVRLHHESDDATYLVKAEDGKWYGIARKDSTYSLARSAARPDILDTQGSVGHYLARPSAEFKNNLSKISGEDREAAVEKAAKFIHNSVKYDYADYEDVRISESFRSREGVKTLVSTKWNDLPLAAKTHYESLASNALDTYISANDSSESVNLINQLSQNIAEANDEDAQAGRSGLKDVLMSASYVIKTWR